MMIIEGAKWEKIFEERQELPDPERYSTEDEKYLYTVLKRTIPERPTRWRGYIKELVGVSEETTTGVHRLY